MYADGERISVVINYPEVATFSILQRQYCHYEERKLEIHLERPRLLGIEVLGHQNMKKIKIYPFGNFHVVYVSSHKLFEDRESKAAKITYPIDRSVQPDPHHLRMETALVPPPPSLHPQDLPPLVLA